MAATLNRLRVKAQLVCDGSNGEAYYAGAWRLGVGVTAEIRDTLRPFPTAKAALQPFVAGHTRSGAYTGIAEHPYAAGAAPGSIEGITGQ